MELVQDDHQLLLEPLEGRDRDGVIVLDRLGQQERVREGLLGDGPEGSIILGRPEVATLYPLEDYGLSVLGEMI